MQVANGGGGGGVGGGGGGGGWVCGGDMHDDTHKALHYFLNRKFVLKRTKRESVSVLNGGDDHTTARRKGSCSVIKPKRGSPIEPHSIKCLMPTNVTVIRV